MVQSTSTSAPAGTGSPGVTAGTHVTAGTKSCCESTQPATGLKGNGKSIGFWLDINGKMTKLFGFRKDKLDEYARVLNEYGERLGNSVTVYSLIPPETGQYLAMKSHSGDVGSKNDMTDYLNSIFNNNVKAVDVFSEINRHKDEYVYFRSDHHWTMRGAYYGYTALMGVNGGIPTPLDQFVIKKVEGSLGSIYRNTLSKTLKNNPDTVELFEPFVDNQFYIYNGKRGHKADVLDMKYTTWQDKYSIFLSYRRGRLVCDKDKC